MLHSAMQSFFNLVIVRSVSFSNTIYHNSFATMQLEKVIKCAQLTTLLTLQQFYAMPQTVYIRILTNANPSY